MFFGRCKCSRARERILLATLVEVTASLAGLASAVSDVAAEVAELKAAPQGAATEADLQVIKDAVDKAVSDLAGLK